MDYLPIFIKLKNKKILVVGGGEVAYRKISLLLDSEAVVYVAAKELCEPLLLLHEEKKIEWISRQFFPEHLNNIWLVIAATDDSSVNEEIHYLAEQKQIFVNVVDQPELCSFIFPSIIDRSPVVVAISSGGKAPVLIKQIREKLEALLPQNIGKAADIAGKWREKVKQKIHSAMARRMFWEKLFRKNFLSLAGNPQEAERYLEESLADFDHSKGKVTLVGAGPGDPGLLTLNALQALQEADVILYDSLVSKGILDISRRDAEKIFVGKKAGNHSVVQDKINELLIFHAKQGKQVVRLKGGDPFIFGRGGEELEIVKKNDLFFQVIPGITAATGAAAYAHIPLTYRGVANGVTLITGCSFKNKEEELSWKSVAGLDHTLVIYMGTLRANEVQQNLIKYGKDSQTPVAVISKATCQDQKVTRGNLSDLTLLADKVEMPALLIIGEVTSFYEVFESLKEVKEKEIVVS
ncbi:MAG: siroheme synthase CysG [Flavobacteriaceae bacterium]|jgi:uroporphyrin-III C-methyltransferase/precorrin-2 dehydrogenase/sirohydrochlorin ferrochelatase|nr:siroheme synthase CysG [Flavobacteriaceae bacterium]